MQEIKDNNVVLADYKKELSLRLKKVQKKLVAAEEKMRVDLTIENISTVHELRITINTIKDTMKRTLIGKPNIAMDSIYIPQQT